MLVGMSTMMTRWRLDEPLVATLAGPRPSMRHGVGPLQHVWAIASFDSKSYGLLGVWAVDVCSQIFKSRAPRPVCRCTRGITGRGRSFPTRCAHLGREVCFASRWGFSHAFLRQIVRACSKLRPASCKDWFGMKGGQARASVLPLPCLVRSARFRKLS